VWVDRSARRSNLQNDRQLEAADGLDHRADNSARDLSGMQRVGRHSDSAPLTMPLTKARTDLPDVGARIVVLHGGGQFYVGPSTVLEVDAVRQKIVIRPDGWPENHSIDHRPDLTNPRPLEWNLLADLTEAEQAELMTRSELGQKARAAMLQRIGPTPRFRPSIEKQVSGGAYE
jgi:hypothetical protein